VGAGLVGCVDMANGTAEAVPLIRIETELRRVLGSSMGDALYWIQPGGHRSVCNYQQQKDYPMTYLEIVFRYGAAPGENELRAIDGMREVYGVRRVQFNEKERTVRVEVDASRLNVDAVAKLLRQAGVDVREPLALA
jgi:hypothetical protein